MLVDLRFRGIPGGVRLWLTQEQIAHHLTCLFFKGLGIEMTTPEGTKIG